VLKPVAQRPEPIIVPDDDNPVSSPSDSTLLADIIPIDINRNDDILDDDFVYVAEIQPEFPGKELALKKFLEENIKYPEAGRKEGLNGMVYVNFIIDEKGNVTNVECKYSPGQAFTEEAIRVVKSMPKWKPGIQGGKPVRVLMGLPVTFKLM